MTSGEGHAHRYAATLAWAGSTGAGYDAYDRGHDIAVGGHAWRGSADVAFRAVPAVWNNAQLGGLARLFYTAQISGDLAALEPAIFAAVQDEKRPLFNEEQVLEWVTGKVADPAKFIETYKSFGVGSQVQRSDQLARAMKIQGVPSMVIDGRFVTSASMSGSHENTLKVADELIARVRKERQGK